MSKFLEGVESHTPEKDLDLFSLAKKQVRDILEIAGYTATAKVFRDEITLTLKDGTRVVLEVKSVIEPAAPAAESNEIEDNEDLAALASAVQTADTIEGVTGNKVGLFGKDGKKMVAKSVNKLYQRTAKTLDEFMK